MKAINKLIDTILPDVFKFIESEERLINGSEQKHITLDINTNTSFNDIEEDWSL